MHKTSSNNRQVQRTRSWIFQALMVLMDEKPYEKITISDITEKAGIARQTFYRNYDEKDDVVFEHISKIMRADLLNIETNWNVKKQSEIVLVFNHNYMVKHRKELKKLMSTAGIENRVLREVQEYPLSLIKPYKDRLTKDEYAMCRYKICYQITGALRVFLDWFLNDMPLPVDAFAAMLNLLAVPGKFSSRHIPNIVVRIHKERP